MLLDFIMYLILSWFHVSPQLYQCLVFLFWLIVKGRRVCFFDIVVVLLLISFFLSFSVEIFPQHLFSSIWVEKVEIFRGVFSNEQGLSRILFDSRAAKLFACKSILRPANNFHSNVVTTSRWTTLLRGVENFLVCKSSHQKINSSKNKYRKYIYLYTLFLQIVYLHM